MEVESERSFVTGPLRHLLIGVLEHEDEEFAARDTSTADSRSRIVAGTARRSRLSGEPLPGPSRPISRSATTASAASKTRRHFALASSQTSAAGSPSPAPTARESHSPPFSTCSASSREVSLAIRS
jgi:hypothetical protein